MKDKNTSSPPVELTRGMTLVLMVLTKGARHGYAIMTEIVSMTDSQYRISAGTLYRSIGQMLKNGLVEEAPELFDPEHDDERRKYYRITVQGRQVVSAELERMARLVTAARSQGIFGNLAGDEA